MRVYSIILPYGVVTHHLTVACLASIYIAQCVRRSVGLVAIACGAVGCTVLSGCTITACSRCESMHHGLQSKQDTQLLFCPSSIMFQVLDTIQSVTLTVTVPWFVITFLTLFTELCTLYTIQSSPL